ncbi:GTPase Era [Chloroflexus islandicus]|uniref:GTPase Era n=1 Tax=Chloroflexus islandicus TaxID=1707952 RepID=A0A178MD45_9CHLR|nr:GTPase Era [Chloroflexus islandicus]OAN46463.1 GTPase Era [Chloroflexus islandicus]
MKYCSLDNDAGTLYFYFLDLEAGQVAGMMEYPAHLLLDAQGAIFGCRIDLDDEVILSQLELALDGPYNWLDGQYGHLYIRMADEEPAEVVDLDETAVLDLDAGDLVVGVELMLPEEWRTPERLARLAPLLVPFDDEPVAGEGPVVFGPPAIVDEAAAEEAVPPELAAIPPEQWRSGFVALVGKPNVGKSTLLNALLGEKVAIVSPRPQTTRVPVRGILTRPGEQIIFIDTPGIHEPDHRLGKLMVELAERTLPNADVICFMVDISQPPSKLDRMIAQQVQRARGHKLLVLNKVDQKPRQPGADYLPAYRELGEWDMEIAISAYRRLGLAALLSEISARLPAGPPLYPLDQITDQNEQQLAAEFVREKALFYLQQEVPHAIAIEVEEWIEKETATYIRMTINVEKESQKGILIGAGGGMLKKIGSAARSSIERMLGRPVFLDLWVKVRPNWRDDPSALGWLGYRAKNFL